MAVKVRSVRDFVEEYQLRDGRRLFVLANGRLVNLSAADGHPAAVMDMSFANQALGLEYLAREGKGLKPLVYNVPEPIDREIARLKLAAMNIGIDVLTEAQRKYLASWESGTT
jgi:adenosylhomocysteinase